MNKHKKGFLIMIAAGIVFLSFWTVWGLWHIWARIFFGPEPYILSHPIISLAFVLSPLSMLAIVVYEARRNWKEWITGTGNQAQAEIKTVS